jgi:ABC-type transport system substrate-binding protein
MVCANAASASSSDTSTTSKSTTSSDRSTDLRIGYNDDIDFQANIFAAYDATPYFIFTEVYDLLLNYKDSNGSPDVQNSPTRKYTVSKNGLTIKFWLRPHMRWSDGKPFTSADVVWSYQHAYMSNVNSGYTVNMKSIKAVSKTLVVMKMKRYDARILSAFVPIVPKHIWAPHAKSSAELTKFNPCCPMVGSGPFYVKSLNTNGTSVLEPNKYFYGMKGHIKRILLIKYDDEDAAKQDLELGQLDAINTGETTWAQEMRKEKDVKLWASPAPGFDELAFNSCPPQGSSGCTGPAPNVNTFVVQNQAIRTALNWAIDRNIIADVVYNGLAPPGTGIISPYYGPRGYYNPDEFKNDPSIDYKYDPAKAHSILVAGGWKCPPINSGGVCTKDGHPAEFNLVLRSSDSQQQHVGLRIQAWAAAVGIKINISIETDDALNAQIYHGTSSKKPADADKYEPTYDAFMWDWGGDVATPDYDFEVLQCGNPSADSMWCNKKYTALVNQALVTKDFKQRTALLHQAERIELKASPYMITDFSPYLSATRTDTWTNWQPAPGADGQPFGDSWVQLQMLQPGKKSGSHYAGAAWVIVFFVGVTALVLGVGYYRRRREEHQPFELPAGPGDPKAAAG